MVRPIRYVPVGVVPSPSRRLAARVRIVRRRRGGRVEIAFASEEELIGLFERLSGKE